MTKEDIASRKASYTLITSSKPGTFSKTTTKACWEISIWQEYSYSGDKGNLDTSTDMHQGGFVAVAKVCTTTTVEIETNDENLSDGSGWGAGTFSGNQGTISGSSIYTTPVVTPGTTFIKTIKPNILRSDFFSLSEKAHELTFNYLTLHNFDQISQSKVRGALLKLNVYALSELPYEVHISVFDNLVKNDFSNESINFGNWTINYLMQNPNVTINQFENWFMGASEGQDGDYDAAFWENPNLTFPQQSLPTFNDFKNACPSKYTDAGTLCNDLGGPILDMYNSVIARGKKLNTCAIRISKAFQSVNIVIPELPDNPNGTKNTVKDKNGNNIIINAKALNIWMRKTFGTNNSNYVHYKASQGGNKGVGFPKLLEHKQGIYSMVSKLEIQNVWGTGHADLLDNGECRLNCHFYDEKSEIVPVDYIDIWILN